MTAYEFQTAVGDGIIQIPLEYRNKLSGNIRVILMQEEAAPGKTMEFPYFAIDTTGYVFNREEANER